MSNPYLEKAASMYEFWNDLTGKDHKDLKARKYHFERAIANKDTVEGLSKRIHETGSRTFKARMKTGGGFAALAAAGLYGTSAFKEHQDRAASRNMNELFLHKQAGVSSVAANLAKKTAPYAKKAGSLVGKGVSKGLDVLNTANGGKIKQMGLNTFGKNTPAYHKFVSAKKNERLSLVAGDNIEKLKKLHSQQTKARVGAYGSIAGISLAYAKGKKKSEALPQSYYYY